MNLFRFLQTAVTGFVLAVPAVHAADPAKQFSIKSVGTSDCHKFLEAGERNDENLLLFAGYLGGYLTAWNQLTPDTFDILPWQNTETLLRLLDHYCRKHPDTNFAVATTRLLRLLEPDKLTAGSRLVEIPADQGEIRIYEETLRRIQLKLQTLEFYQGEINGSFDEPTREALKKFQQASGLPATGLPDQRTLYRLLLKLPAAS
jgi:hypothetical protein